MISEHPRLGFAVLGGILVAIVTLAVLILRTGGGLNPELVNDAAPAVVTAPVQESAQAPGRGTAQNSSRGAARKSAESSATRVDPAWAATMGAKTGIPAPALKAYADAELRIAREQPGCHLSWNTLAGIGWIESHHGTIGDRTVGADGRSSTPIIGPALDGKQFAAIRSTPTSRTWHGDATWEHAVGPLQFIASTWDRWGADGDGDGTADPLDLDDAALAAGNYLCADNHDLSSAAGWNAAIFSYNHDQAYVSNVLNAANTYATRSAS